MKAFLTTILIAVFLINKTPQNVYAQSQTELLKNIEISIYQKNIRNKENIHKILNQLKEKIKMQETIKKTKMANRIKLRKNVKLVAQASSLISVLAGSTVFLVNPSVPNALRLLRSILGNYLISSL
ncbi:MAG: hypothetical protein LBJ32_02445 [Oscillospiraceae bacterium]|nr:hypothetical protein [Oscillospiraceae bacterium]